ncbi:hypothetical protein MVEN_02107800 [Mycena venus]|uniref:Uncharacterized protein n=1 Tax=Mycena venus TaxID=2733690 RepID=A0A8H6X931_9AGAR|nr:hypothetical protein MVEN_02107800 [Mycena venus]
MQARRPSTGLTPLSIVLPPSQAPPSQVLSIVPRHLAAKSTDSWNSSNQDLDDLDYDWKPDQILLLRRTLDALPPHLMTPFNGPIPPSNLLDKIARGCNSGKGRGLASFSACDSQEDSKPRKTIPEESAMDCSESYFAESDVLQQTTNIGIGKIGLGIGLGPRRPLYRQSSMDFLDTSDPQDNDTINRLSTRLQKADRFIPNAFSHPYSRSQIQRRSSSPPRPSHVPSLISGSSSTTLASLSTAGSHPRLRRSASTISSSTTSNSRMSLSSAGGLPPIAADPRVQRVRRSESFCSPSTPARKPVKRAPSYGALAQEARDKMPEDDIAAPCPSSDEEEKIRTRRAKKARTRSPSTGSPPLSPSPAPSPPSSATRSPGSSQPTPKAASPEAAGPSKRTTKKKASVKAAESQSGVADLPTKVRRERPKGMNAKKEPEHIRGRAPSAGFIGATAGDPGCDSAALPVRGPAPRTPAGHGESEDAPEGPEVASRAENFIWEPYPSRRGRDGHEADMEECEEDSGLGSAFQLR